MLNYKTDSYHVLYGDSLNDVQAYLNSTPKVWRDNQARINRASMRWDLGVGWEGAVRMARDGWSEGAKRLSDTLAVLMPPNDKETDTRYDVAGYFPDVGRFVAGDPAHMVRRGRTHGHPPVVNIVVALTTSGGVDAQHYANFGAAMTNVIDRIEAGGRRVELSVMFPNAFRRHRCLAGWRVKAAEDHCDLAAIAFSIGHPAAYRRFGFALWEYTDQINWTSGYGHCTSFTKEDAETMGFEEPIIVNGEGSILSACTTPQKALEFVRQRINQAAGEELVTLDN